MLGLAFSDGLATGEKENKDSSSSSGAATGPAAGKDKRDGADSKASGSDAASGASGKADSKQQAKAGGADVVTNASLTVARFIGKYISIMRDLRPLAVDGFNG